MANVAAQWLHPNGLLLLSSCALLLLLAPSMADWPYDGHYEWNTSHSVTINIYPGVPAEIPPNATWSLAKQTVNFSATLVDLKEISGFINKFREMLFRPGKMTEITTALYSDEDLFSFFEEATDTGWPGQPGATEAFTKIREEIKRVYALEVKDEAEIDGKMEPIGRKQKWNWIYDLFMLRALCQFLKAGLEAFRNKLAVMTAEFTVVAVGICAQGGGLHRIRADVYSIKSACPKTVDELFGKNEDIIKKIGDWFTFREDNIGKPFSDKWKEYNTKMAELFGVELTLNGVRLHNSAEAVMEQHQFRRGFPFDGPHHERRRWNSVEFELPHGRAISFLDHYHHHHHRQPFYPPPPADHFDGYGPQRRQRQRFRQAPYRQRRGRGRGQGRGRPRSRAPTPAPAPTPTPEPAPAPIRRAHVRFSSHSHHSYDGYDGYHHHRNHYECSIGIMSAC